VCVAPSFVAVEVRLNVLICEPLAVRMHAETEQIEHLLLGHLLTVDPEQRRTAPGPHPRRVALRSVIIRRRLPPLALHITASNLTGEVRVAVSGRQFVDGHHADHPPLDDPNFAVDSGGLNRVFSAISHHFPITTIETVARPNPRQRPELQEVSCWINGWLELVRWADHGRLVDNG